MALIDCFKDILSESEFEAIQNRIKDSTLSQDEALLEVLDLWENSLFDSQRRIVETANPQEFERLENLRNQNLEQDEKRNQESESGEREPVQGSEQDDASENNTSEEVGDERTQLPEQTQQREDQRDGEQEVTTTDDPDQAEVQQGSGLRPDEPVGPTAPENAQSQDAYTFAQVDEATAEVTQLMEQGRENEAGGGMSFDDAFNEVKNKYVDAKNTETKVRHAIEAKRRENQVKRQDELSDTKPYANFNSSNWKKFLRWYKKKVRNQLRGAGPLTREAFAIIEEKRGTVQSNIDRARTLGKKLTKVTKNLSEVDKENVDKILKGASADILTSDVDADTKSKILRLTREMRNQIDGLSRQLEGLGIFEQPFLDSVRDAEGSYVNRIYMKNIDKNWPDKIDKRVWVNAKAAYRKQLFDRLNNPNIKPENKDKFAKYLSDDAELDKYMRQIVSSNKHDSILGIGPGGLQGSKDIGITKKRKEIPKEIREFYGEITDAELNNLNTVSKLATFVANTKMLNDLQAMGLDEQFISETPQTNPDGTQWVEINKSGSKTLEPLDSPIYVEPEVADFLQIQRNNLPWWVRESLRFNGLVKAGKTIFSPTTQVRNFLSAGFWMAANGNWNPANFNEARKIIFNARKVKGIDKKGLVGKAAAAVLGDIDIDEANKRWRRLIELQVADQNVVNRELNDFFKSVSGDSFRSVWEDKAPQWLKSFVDKPRQAYSDVDDFYRISYYLSQEKVLSKGLFNKPVSQLTDSERVQVEEQAAQIVRDTYPNYSKIYPLINKLRSFPFLGAFVSFSAEMIRTTANQFMQAARELRHPNRAIKVSGAKRAIGLAAVSYFTFEALTAMARQWGFDEETEKDMREDRPPWVETMLPVKNLGNGVYTYVNPATINPYGYFSDIVNAGNNAGGFFTPRGMGKSVLKTLEPFIGPEVSVDVFADVIGEAMQETDSRTSGEKIVDATVDIINGLQPGFTYTLGRIANPKVDSQELEQNPDLITEKRWNEIIAAVTGLRISTLNTLKSFEINKGKKILKQKRRARKKFNSVFYGEMRKPEAQRDMDRIDRQYKQSLEIYNDFLDIARENASRLQRLGISADVLREAHKKGGVNFDRTTFSNAEISYIFGDVDVKPRLIFDGYNKAKISVRRRGSRR